MMGMSATQTTPTENLTADDEAPRSQRTTFDVAAIASVAGLCDTRGNRPLDACVPVRTSDATPSALTRDELCVLLFVDGDASLKQIADQIGLPLSETVVAFLGLLRWGLIEIVGEPPLSQSFVDAVRD